MARKYKPKGGDAYLNAVKDICPHPKWVEVFHEGKFWEKICIMCRKVQWSIEYFDPEAGEVNKWGVKGERIVTVLDDNVGKMLRVAAYKAWSEKKKAREEERERVLAERKERDREQARLRMRENYRKKKEAKMKEQEEK